MKSNITAHTDSLVGTRVRVTTSARYGDKCKDREGVVRSVWAENSIGVEIPGMINQGSKFGFYYFERAELIIISENNTTTETGGKNMNILTNYVNIAKVRFLNDNQCFRLVECANYDPDLTEGDLCVVKTAHHGMGLAEVDEIVETTKADIYREIVAKVHTAAYDDRVRQREEAAELKAKMQERAKQLQDIVLFQTLAKEDPEMARMLQSYLALNNTATATTEN